MSVLEILGVVFVAGVLVGVLVMVPLTLY